MAVAFEVSRIWHKSTCMTSKTEMFAIIEQNIADHGQHLYSVVGDLTPSFIYSIGLSLLTEFELVMAGYSYYSMEEAACIVNAVADQIRGTYPRERQKYVVKQLGEFTLGFVDQSWSSQLLLGANDYLKKSPVKAVQIIPEPKHRTIDTPLMSIPFSKKNAPAWQWEKKAWKFPVPEASLVFTHLEVLQGHEVTEVTRWEPDQWEMFSRNPDDVDKSTCRCIPLAVMLGFDPTL